MESLQSKLENIGEVLAKLETKGVKVSHYRRKMMPPPWICWMETGTHDMYADNGIEEQAISGRIYAYTQTEFDPILDRVQEVLENLENCAFRLRDVDYDAENNVISYEWEFEKS